MPTLSGSPMNVAVLLSVCVSILQCGLGILLLAVSRAPGWRQARLFAVIAMCAAGYSLGNVGASYHPLPDALRLAASTFSYVSAALFVAGWLLYAFGGREGRVRDLPRWAALLMAACLASGAVALTGVHVESGTFNDVSVRWAGLRYRFPRPNAIGTTITLVYLTGILCVCAAFMRRRRQGRVNGEYLFGFSLFLIATALEVLVTNGALEFPFTADLGFIAVVIPMAAETVRRFIDHARRLATVSSQLTEEIEIRTQERDDAHHAWIEAERHASVGRLAAGVGHEINNPLAYLRLNVELIGEWGREHSAPPELMESVEGALDGADRIRRVVDALRASSRQGSGELTPVSPEAITQSALRVVAHQLRGIRVDVAIEPAPSVMGDEARLVQAMVNLLLNASQAADSGAETGRRTGGAGSNQDAQVIVRVGRDDGGRATIDVADTGPGLSREELRRLMQPFFSTHGEAGGKGLGLFLARGVVEQHGGVLEVESRPGAGTRVRVTLPPASERPRSVLESLDGRGVSPRAHVGLPPVRATIVGH